MVRYPEPMPSPLESSPYEVLGVSAAATQDELRRAYRRALRATHPDTGGDPQRFAAVQAAWDRIGTEQARSAYDSARSSRDDTPYAPRTRAERQDTRPRTRSHGHPGGWRRERFLAEMREWVGRGVTVPDPYDAALVRSAPRAIRRILADALAEEASARALSALGIGFTVWHDVATGDPEQKVDHVVLGPSGLWAILSEDPGGAVAVRRGELVGEGLDGERPLHALAARAKLLARSWRVRFTALAVVVPDEFLDEPIIEAGTIRGMRAIVVRQSVLGHALRTGIPGARLVGGTELFDVRTRIAGAVRFV